MPGREPVPSGHRMVVFLAAVVFAAGCRSYDAADPPAGPVPDGVEINYSPRTIELFPAGDGPGYAAPDDGARKPAGLIFYPGALVAPEAYVSLLWPLARAGHPVVVVKMPFDLAVLGAERAIRALADLPDQVRDRPWVLAGHSLGGTMAARLVARGRAESVRGLALLAAYPAKSDSLAGSTVPVVAIWAENDGLVTREDRYAAVPLLPDGTQTVVIRGGNHAGFGDYGDQKGDGRRSISLETQHAVTRTALTELLGTL